MSAGRPPDPEPRQDSESPQELSNHFLLPSSSPTRAPPTTHFTSPQSNHLLPFTSPPFIRTYSRASSAAPEGSTQSMTSGHIPYSYSSMHATPFTSDDRFPPGPSFHPPILSPHRSTTRTGDSELLLYGLETPLSPSLPSAPTTMHGLQWDNARLRRELNNTHIELRTTQKSYNQLLVVVAQHLASASQDSHASKPVLKAEDYPKVKYWYAHQWKEAEDEHKAITDPDADVPLRGSSRASKNINVMQRFVEDANGHTVDGFRAAAIRDRMQSLWRQLYIQNLAPPTWGTVRGDVEATFCTEMVEAFPELGFCANNWKVKRIATTTYSSWYKNYHRKMSGIVSLDQPDSAQPAPDAFPANVVSRDVAAHSRKRPVMTELLLDSDASDTHTRTPTPKRPRPIAHPPALNPITTSSMPTSPSRPSLSRPSELNTQLEIPRPQSPSDPPTTTAAPTASESSTNSSPVAQDPVQSEVLNMAPPRGVDMVQSTTGSHSPIRQHTIQSALANMWDEDDGPVSRTNHQDLPSTSASPRVSDAPAAINAETPSVSDEHHPSGAAPSSSTSGFESEALASTARQLPHASATSLSADHPPPSGVSSGMVAPPAASPNTAPAQPARKRVSRKGDQLMEVTDAFTARNMYAKEWVANHPGGTVGEFRSDFTALPDSEMKKYARRARELKKGQQDAS